MNNGTILVMLFIVALVALILFQRDTRQPLPVIVTDNDAGGSEPPPQTSLPWFRFGTPWMFGPPVQSIAPNRAASEHVMITGDGVENFTVDTKTCGSC